MYPRQRCAALLTRSVTQVWVVCVHTDAITSARLLHGESDSQPTGEAVCAACRALLDAGKEPPSLRLACGDCVRKLWPIENAS